jgi:hypothetical protein
LALAWELIPYSFVVDWLFPVGDYLSSLDALVGVSDLSYYTVDHIDKVMVGSAHGGVWRGELRYYYRTPPATNLPLPRFGYKPSVSSTKVANGIALLKQLRPR